MLAAVNDRAGGALHASYGNSGPVGLVRRCCSASPPRRRRRPPTAGPCSARGRPGAGDPYFPLDGNGGYDVQHYLLDVAYDPPTGRLVGDGHDHGPGHAGPVSASTSTSTGSTSARSTVDGRPARVAPRRRRADRHAAPRRAPTGGRFTDGRALRRRAADARRTSSAPGFIHTDDGALVVGQPHVAATWFPVNDHPSDKAAYTFRVTVPEGLEAVANGALESQAHQGRPDHVDLGRAASRWPRTSPRRRSASSTCAPTRQDGIRVLGRARPRPLRPGGRPPHRRAVRRLPGRRRRRTSA